MEVVQHKDFVSALSSSADFLTKNKSALDGRRLFSREVMALRIRRDGSSVQISCDEIDDKTYAAFGPVHDRSILMEFMTSALDTLKVKSNRRAIYIPEKFADGFLRSFKSVLARVKPSAFSRFFELFRPRLAPLRRFLRTQVVPLRLQDLFDFQGVLFAQFVESDKEQFKVFFVKDSVLIESKEVVTSPEITEAIKADFAVAEIPQKPHYQRSAFLWWFFVWRKRAHSDRFIALES